MQKAFVNLKSVNLVQDFYQDFYKQYQQYLDQIITKTDNFTYQNLLIQNWLTMMTTLIITQSQQKYIKLSELQTQKTDKIKHLMKILRQDQNLYNFSVKLIENQVKYIFNTQNNQFIIQLSQNIFNSENLMYFYQLLDFAQEMKLSDATSTYLISFVTKVYNILLLQTQKIQQNVDKSFQILKIYNNYILTIKHLKNESQAKITFDKIIRTYIKDDISQIFIQIIIMIQNIFLVKSQLNIDDNNQIHVNQQYDNFIQKLQHYNLSISYQLIDSIFKIISISNNIDNSLQYYSKLLIVSQLLPFGFLLLNIQQQQNYLQNYFIQDQIYQNVTQILQQNIIDNSFVRFVIESDLIKVEETEKCNDQYVQAIVNKNYKISQLIQKRYEFYDEQQNIYIILFDKNENEAQDKLNQIIYNNILLQNTYYLEPDLQLLNIEIQQSIPNSPFRNTQSQYQVSSPKLNASQFNQEDIQFKQLCIQCIVARELKENKECNLDDLIDMIQMLDKYNMLSKEQITQAIKQLADQEEICKIDNNQVTYIP